MTFDDYIFTTEHGCGRYALTEPKNLKKRFKAKESPDLGNIEIEPNYNAAPTQTMPVITSTNGQNYIELMRWGLIPSWWSKPLDELKFSTFNATMEKLTSGAVWRGPFKYTRCLIPFNAFYEWRRKGEPFLFSVDNKQLSAFAGLYDRWVVKATGEVISSYTIITTTPDATMKGIHNRMPVILDPDEEKLWLQAEADESSDLLAMMNPYGSQALHKYPVSADVGPVKNNNASLLEEAA